MGTGLALSIYVRCGVRSSRVTLVPFAVRLAPPLLTTLNPVGM